jgi:hypothetical protein
MSRLYEDLQIDMNRFWRLRINLQKVMMTDNYVSLTDIYSLLNFIHELYPGFDIEKIREDHDLKDLQILAYRILLTR